MIASTAEARQIAPARDPLIIEVGQQGDGSVYELRPESVRRILQHVPQAAVASSLFIGTYRPEDRAQIQEARWREIVRLLTGLSEEQIHQMGEIMVFDPVAGQVLWRSWGG